MAWICDRCKKPDPTLGDSEKPYITLVLTISDTKDIKDRWEVCLPCFKWMKKQWDLSIEEVKP